MPSRKKITRKKTVRSRKTTKKVLVMSIADVFIASSAKQRTYIEQINFAPRNFTQKHLGTICGFFMVRDKSSWSAHIVHFLNAEFKKEYFSQPKRSMSESFIAALHHTNRALAELAKNDNINWIGMLDSVVCAYDDTTIHFSVTGGGSILLLRNQELVDISEGLSPEQASPNPLKTFVDTANGKLVAGDKLILTSSELLELVPLEELEKNLGRFDNDEFFQFVSTVLTNECQMASTQIITVSEKELSDSQTIPRPHGIISDADLEITSKDAVQEEEEVIIPQNAFSAKQYDTNKKESPYIPDGSKDQDPTPSARAKKNPTTNTVKDSTSPVLNSPGEEYVDKRTGHIYVAGDTPEKPASTVHSYIDTAKDYFHDFFYFIKKWSRSASQNITHLVTQAPTVFHTSLDKFRSNKNDDPLHLDTETAVQANADMPKKDVENLSKNVLEKTEKKSTPQADAPLSPQPAQKIKKTLSFSLTAIKDRLKISRILARCVTLLQKTRSWISQIYTKALSLLPSSWVYTESDEHLSKDHGITEDINSLLQDSPTKTPTTATQKTTSPAYALTEKTLAPKEVRQSAKTQTRAQKTLKVPSVDEHDRFSVLDELYAQEQEIVGFDEKDHSFFTKIIDFFHPQIARLRPLVSKIRGIFPKILHKKNSAISIDHSPSSKQSNSLVEETLSDNLSESTFSSGFFPQLTAKIHTLVRYIRKWKIGNVIIKVLMGIFLIAFIAYPLYQNIITENQEDEDVVRLEEKAFQENLSETVKEELTILEPTKTVADPEILAQQSKASHSFIFKDTAYFAAGTDLLVTNQGDIQTIPLPKDSGSITFITPMDDLNLIIFLTDENILYAYNPSTNIFNKQTIDTPLDHTNILAMSSYQQKFYIASNQGITRYDRSVGGFTSPTAWIKDSTAVDNLTALSVDGNVFVAKDDKVLAFESGSLLPISSPDNIKVQHMYKTETMENLWVMDTTNFTIYKLNPQTLAVEELFVHDQLRDALSFSVDEGNSIAYIATDENILSLDLVNT